ncbi:MAG: alcohol dehydrogenase catalytic domain-containing protein [Symbiobacteriia bacterium]
MRAMVLQEFGGRLVAADLPRPALGPGDALVKVAACGVCQTDLKIIKGGHASSPRIHFPHTPGHEVAGVVAELAPGATGVQVGDPVVVNIYDICGTCEYCRSGRESLCSNLGAWIGFDAPGGMAEYVRVPARNLIRVPAGHALEKFAIAGDAIATCVRAVETRGEVKKGQTVLVTGVGGVGVHAIQVARAIGARVFAADVAPAKLELARRYGAESLVSGPSLPEEVKALTGGAGVDVAFDFTGLPAALAAAAGSVKKGGRLVMVGYQVDTALSIPTQSVVIGELEIRGSRYANRAEFQRAVELVTSGVVEPVVGAVMPLEQVNDALDMIRAGQANGRIVLTI